MEKYIISKLKHKFIFWIYIYRYIFVLSMWKLTLGSSSHLMTGKISVSRTGTIQYFWWYGTCSCRSPYTLVFHKVPQMAGILSPSCAKSGWNKKVGMNPVYSEKREWVNWFSHLNLLWKDFHPHFWICLTLASITPHNINTTVATLITKSQLPYPWNP
jgi:hypothetical protein